MKKIMFALFILFSLNSISQIKPQLGWYIVQNKVEFTTVIPSFSDIEIDGFATTANLKLENYLMATGETVLVYDFVDGKYFCFDPAGRTVVFNGMESLKKAPVNEVSSVGFILEDIELLSGNDIKKGMYVWITSQNVANGTIIITIENNKTLEIPKKSIQLLSRQIQNISKELIYQITK